MSAGASAFLNLAISVSEMKSSWAIHCSRTVSLNTVISVFFFITAFLIF
jgi:hypothetical protein